ncbi:hypothetical protein Scep_015794 [Stephania cephalantha]|uniref:PPM-type phosphatase domain-containing protein n=1 Tax=Stephania cephalantha TaxID=152367 RepID=A0AAP0J5V0_9MAGN
MTHSSPPDARHHPPHSAIISHSLIKYVFATHISPSPLSLFLLSPSASNGPLSLSAKSGHPLFRPDLAEREGTGEADRKSGWSVVMDDGDGSAGGRWAGALVRLRETRPPAHPLGRNHDVPHNLRRFSERQHRHSLIDGLRRSRVIQQPRPRRRVRELRLLRLPPLQPVPRAMKSGPLIQQSLSGPIERGFERGFMSGPIERGFVFSGPLDSIADQKQRFQRSYSHGGLAIWRGRQSLIGQLKRAIARKVSSKSSIVAPIKKENEWGGVGSEKNSSENMMTVSSTSSTNLSSEGSLEEEEGGSEAGQGNVQWAQGKAGEDRVHVVISEDHGWVFVGIYDGFNGPDAPDYLLSNLYCAVHKELKGLLWEDKFESLLPNSSEMEVSTSSSSSSSSSSENYPVSRKGGGDSCSQCVVEPPENYPISTRNRSRKAKDRFKGAARKWEESHERWKCEWDRERLELDLKLKEQLGSGGGGGGNSGAINHSDVLKALSQALRMTEEAYLDIADKMVMVNPELALMGSCVLVMLMKGEDVYVMNVGDSRALVAQKAEPELWIGKPQQDLERINEETLRDLKRSMAINLIQRIKNEHPDDASAVTNDRVKGSLKVTRAFGAGFLKQFAVSVLELKSVTLKGPKDRFLILSSDGLYQYFTNEEAVSQVELFIATSPEGDPAQHLVEEVLFRAAKKAGMDFHELLEIPQGDRRRYHDDISIIVISLEGRIWRSCV